MTVNQNRAKNINSISHIRAQYSNKKRPISEEASVILYNFNEELGSEDKENLAPNIMTINNMLRGVGFNGSLDLLYKLGRFLHNNPDFYERLLSPRAAGGTDDK